MPYFTRYQWTVLFAAWLGWGFDVFDGLLSNYLRRTAVQPSRSALGPERSSRPVLTGLLTSVRC